jgi:hypothetical protein
MSERWRLLGGGAEVQMRPHGDQFSGYVVMTVPGATMTVARHHYLALTEPIPEEEPVSLVVEADLPVAALIDLESRLFEAVGPYLPDHVSLRLTRPKPIPEEEAKPEGPQPDPIADLLARVEALEERLQDLSDAYERHINRHHGITPQEMWDLYDDTPTPAAADGPSAEEEWLVMGPKYPREYEVGSLLRNAVDHNGTHFFLTCSIGELAHRVCRMIRAAQEDTRPVLTEQVVEAAWERFGDRPETLRVALRAALLATKAFREPSNG